MANSVYTINKGINKPIEFQGLKAQYIAYLAIGLVSLLLFFAITYMLGMSLLFCLPVVLIGGSALFYFVFRLSHKYGQYGLLKKAARRSMPAALQLRSRKCYENLKKASHATAN